MAKGYKYEAGQIGRLNSLNWGFIVWPSNAQKELGFKWPESKSDFKIPPMDIP